MVSKFGFAGKVQSPRLRLLPMSFSLDITKPLGRLGLALNLIVLTVLFYLISAVSFKYMTVTLPHQGAAHHSAEIAEQTAEKAFEKAKKAAKGKAFDEKAAHEQAKVAGEAEVKKRAEETHGHAVSGWAPFAIFSSSFPRFSSPASFPSRSSGEPMMPACSVSGFAPTISGPGSSPASWHSTLSWPLTTCATLGPRPSSPDWFSSCRC